MKHKLNKVPKLQTRSMDCWFISGTFIWTKTPLAIPISLIVRIPRGKPFLTENADLRQLEHQVAEMKAEQIPCPLPTDGKGNQIGIIGDGKPIPMFKLQSAAWTGVVEVAWKEEKPEPVPTPETVQ